MYEAIFHVCLNLLLGFVAVTSSTMTNGTSNSFQDAGLKYKEPETQAENSMEESLEAPAQNQNVKDYVQRENARSLADYKSNYYVTFHFLMMIFSVYLVMIFFDWKALNLDFDQWIELLSSSPSGFAVKTFNAFFIAAIYIWTLVAPMIFPDRTFS